jgi:hypothetical protein
VKSDWSSDVSDSRTPAAEHKAVTQDLTVVKNKLLPGRNTQEGGKKGRI